MDIGKEHLLTNRTAQLAAYAGVANIMSHAMIGVQDAYSQLKRHDNGIGLEINTKLCTDGMEGTEIDKKITHILHYPIYSDHETFIGKQTWELTKQLLNQL